MQDERNLPDFAFNTFELKLKGFKVYEIATAVNPVPTFSRRDFYKICLISGKSIIHYADRAIQIDDSALFFANPHIPYASEMLLPDQTGYACLFTEDFLKSHSRSESLQQSPLFKIGGTPVFFLADSQKAYIESIFRKMIEEQDTDYIFKQELIQNFINLIIHEALRMQPAEDFMQPQSASSRTTSLFLELLERQFPIESPEHPLQLKTAQDYADQLSIHVNHLNRSIKEVTGKSTTTHIKDRVVSEAKALLQHTDWNIAAIAEALGFEYHTYFNNYFKKITGTVPSSLRN